MKECELCNSPARMFCESDQASLCWECDSKVHSANFLVARHPRNLLCHVCQTKTPWQASGSKLGPTVTVCERCVKRRDATKEDDSEETANDDDDDVDGDQEEETDDDDDDDGGDDDEEESSHLETNDEDGDNQVVPWSSSASSNNPPPAVSSSSSSEESSSARFRSHNASLKRTRENDNPQDGADGEDFDLSGLSCRGNRAVDLVRPSKDRKRRLRSIRRFEEIDFFSCAH